MSIKALNWAWQAPVKGVQKLVLLALADHADDQGYCWPGVRSLTEKCGISRSGLIDQINRLVKAGYMVKKPRTDDSGRSSTNLYILNLQAPITKQAKPKKPPKRKRTDAGQTSVKSEPKIGTFEDLSDGRESVHQADTNHHIEPSVRNKRKKEIKKENKFSLSESKNLSDVDSGKHENENTMENEKAIKTMELSKSANATEVIMQTHATSALSLPPESSSPPAMPNENQRLREEAREILEFLNEMTQRRFRPVETNLKPIMARLKSGVSALDIRRVIICKVDEWQQSDNPAFRDLQYATPDTLFRPSKFEKYLTQMQQRFGDHPHE